MSIPKGIKFHLIAFLAFYCLINNNVFGQNSCSQTLKQAQKKYEQGSIETIPSLIEPCIKTGFSRIELLQAYRLMILSYLFLDEQESAERWMNNLLEYEPDYKPNVTLDPIEYINLYKSFRVEPFFSLGVALGVNQARPRMVNNFGLGNTVLSPSVYTPGIGLNLGVTFDLILYRSLFLTADGILSFKNYSSVSNVLPKSNVSSNESQTWINVPLTLKYVIGRGKFKFFLRAGGSFDLLLSDQSALVRKNTQTGQNEFAGPNVDLASQRNKINFSALAGAGFTYKVGYGFIILDARYYYGLTNISNPETRYKDFNTQITRYGYLDNDIALDNFQISIGYMYSLYKIIKIKNPLP